MSNRERTAIVALLLVGSFLFVLWLSTPRFGVVASPVVPKDCGYPLPPCTGIEPTPRPTAVPTTPPDDCLNPGDPGCPPPPTPVPTEPPCPPQTTCITPEATEPPDPPDPPDPEDTPTPTPTSEPPPQLGVTATLTLRDDDLTVSYRWKLVRGASGESWAITLQQSSSRSGSYSRYRTANSSAAANTTFPDVQTSRWYRAKVSACDEFSNCASATSNKIWVPPVPPPPPTPTVSISAKTTSVTEGQSITFTLTASSAPGSNLPVNVDVTQSGSFIKGTATTSVTIASGQTSASFKVNTHDDSVDEPSGSITAKVKTGTDYGVGSSSSITATVLDNDLAKLASPDILGVEPRPLRRARLKWRGVPNADKYVVEARDPEARNPTWAPVGTPTCAIPPAQTAEVCTIDIKLDRVVNSRGFGHANAFEFRVKAVSATGTILPSYSDIITIIDNPILTGGRVSGYNVGEEGRAVLQWGRIRDATDYVVKYRKLGRRPSYEGTEGLSHTEENWPGALGWPFYEDISASPLEFGAGASDPVGWPVTDLELGELYAFQVNYRTSTTTVYSARDAYVWPSSDYPENGKRVGTYTFFGHHEDKEFEYIICKDTFPEDQRDQWVELIKSAFGHWATSTDGLITMTPRVHGENGWHCSDTSLPISQFIMEDDERNEVRMFNLEKKDSTIYSLPEMKSDVFKICVDRRPACVTSFTGYAGINFPYIQRLAIAHIVDDPELSLIEEQAAVGAILNAHGSQAMRQASSTIKSVDVNFNRRDPDKPKQPDFTPRMPDKVQFNTCFSGGTADFGDATTEKHYFPCATAVHEAGHAAGLSNVNYPILGDVPDEASHPSIPDAAMNYDSSAKSAFPGWGILNPGHEEPDCSPHPFDVMAIFVLYGRVP